MVLTRPRQAMYVGLALTVLVLLVPLFDKAMLAGHIQAGYPAYDHSRIGSAMSIYLIYLSVLGALGILGWAATIWLARKPWAPWLATALFVIGTSIATFNLLVKDTSGDTGLPPLFGWIGLLPCVAGLIAVVLLWRKGAEA